MRQVLRKPHQYPPLVAINGKIYHVVFVGALPGAVGMCDPKAKLILMLKGQEPIEMTDTFWHEVLHGFEEEFNCPLGHPKIRKLSQLIVEVLAQLPDLEPKTKQEPPRKRPRSKQKRARSG